MVNLPAILHWGGGMNCSQKIQNYVIEIDVESAILANSATK